MYNRILVPLDGSTLAEQVLPYVRMLSASLKLPIVLLRVFSEVSEQYADPLYGRYLDAVAESFRNRAMDYLHEVKRTLTDLDAEVTCIVHEGHSASWIVTEAEREAGTIIAMSTHGRSGITRWLLGSVTDKVLHTTTTPLLLVRPQDGDGTAPMPELTSVIVPLDGSPLAEQSLPHVAALAKAAGLNVILVRAETHDDATFRSYLHEIQEQLHEQGVHSVEERMLHGHAAENIVDLAHESKNSMVAMTTHGRSGIGRWMMGSVTDRVVRHSGSPVLVIRSEE